MQSSRATFSSLHTQHGFTFSAGFASGDFRSAAKLFGGAGAVSLNGSACAGADEENQPIFAESKIDVSN